MKSMSMGRRRLLAMSAIRSNGLRLGSFTLRLGSTSFAGFYCTATSFPSSSGSNGSVRSSQRPTVASVAAIFLPLLKGRRTLVRAHQPVMD